MSEAVPETTDTAKGLGEVLRSGGYLLSLKFGDCDSNGQIGRNSPFGKVTAFPTYLGIALISALVLIISLQNVAVSNFSVYINSLKLSQFWGDTARFFGITVFLCSLGLLVGTFMLKFAPQKNDEMEIERISRFALVWLGHFTFIVLFFLVLHFVYPQITTWRLSWIIAPIAILTSLKFVDFRRAKGLRQVLLQVSQISATGEGSFRLGGLYWLSLLMTIYVLLFWSWTF